MFNSILKPYDGFIKGNIFENLYDKYKDYKIADLNPNNNKAKLLLDVDMLSFIAHDINLYLDVFPDDKKMIDLFNYYNDLSNKAKINYINNYGPLVVDEANSNNDYFIWEKTTWPWEDR